MRNFKEYQEVVYDIIGCAMEVHSTLKWGLLESVYSEALCLELAEMGIEAEREAQIPCFYKGHQLEKSYRADMVVDDIVVELKSAVEIVPAHRSQLFNYMRLTQKPVGLLINFGKSGLQGERYAYIAETNECVLLDKNMNLRREARMDLEIDEDL